MSAGGEAELSQTPEPRNEPADFSSPDAKFRTIGSLEIFLLVDSLASDAQRHPDHDDEREQGREHQQPANKQHDQARIDRVSRQPKAPPFLPKPCSATVWSNPICHDGPMSAIAAATSAMPATNTAAPDLDHGAKSRAASGT